MTNGTGPRRETLVVRGISDTQVEVVDCDVISIPQPVDVIVSIDDNYWTHSSRVAGLVWAAAGPDLASEISAKGRPRFEEVVFTNPGRLPARAVAHCIAEDLDTGLSASGPSIMGLVGRVLGGSSDRDFKSVVLPVFARSAGEGAFSVSGEGVLELMSDEIRNVRWWPRQIERIVLSVPGPGFVEAARLLRGYLGQTRSFRDTVASATRLMEETAAESLNEKALQLHGSAAELVDKSSSIVSTALAAFVHTVLPDNVTNLTDVQRGRIREALGEVGDDAGRDGWIALEPSERWRLVSGRPDRALWRIAETLAGSNESAERDPKYTLRLLLAESAANRRQDGDDLRAALAGRMEAAESLLIALLRWRRGHEEMAPREPDATVAGPSGTLVAFLSKKMSGARKAVLQDHLRAAGYSGEFEEQIREYCAVADPEEILREYFGAHELRREVRWASEEVEREHSRDAVVSRVLQQLGFPPRRQRPTLERIEDELETRWKQCAWATEVELNGFVTISQREVEYVLKTLVSYVCKAAFGCPPEVHLGVSPYDWKRAALGTLAGWSDRVDRDLRASAAHVAEQFRRNAGVSRLAPEGKLIEIRNDFMHWREGPVSPGEWRRRTTAFLYGALDYVRWLRRPETRVFPHVVSVTDLRVDRWGRTIVTVTDDRGRNEYLASDRPLAIGALYYVRWLDSPRAVHVLFDLIEAKDVGEPWP